MSHAHALHLETSTGLDSRKLAIWTFIGSECLFFATLISNYLVNKSRNLIPPYPHDVTLANGPRAFGSQYLARGGHWSKRFDVPGTYQIYCTLHPVSMHEIVTVS